MARFAHFDMSEVKDFVRDLGQVERLAARESKDPVKDAAQRLVRDWQRNAREIDLPHGKWYPRSIGFDGPFRTPAGWEALCGPNSAMLQGGMGRGFEYGSINQDSPHMEGNRAADSEVPRFARAVDRWGEQILWHLIT